MTVVMVGAGPAGLAGAFWRLRDDPDCDLVVLDAGSRPGGWVHSERLDGYTCEVGPQAVRPSTELDDLVAALGAEDDLVPAAEAAKARWIGRGGKLLAVPMGPGQLLTTRLLTTVGKLRLFKEPFVRKGDPDGESITSFMSRRFGAQTAPLVSAMISGIFAGDADLLEVESAFPFLAEAERDHGSVFKGMKHKRKAAGPRPKKAKTKRPSLYTFRGGMETLMRRMVERLGNRLQPDTTVVSVLRVGDGFVVRLADGSQIMADELVLACPARVSAALLRDLDPQLAQDLAAIPFASLVSVYVGVPAAALPDTARGFGFLLEPAEQSPVLGAIYCSSLFPDHAPSGHALMRVMIGGARHPEVMDLDDDGLIRLAEDALRRYAGIEAASVFCHVVRVRSAIPQYESGHSRRMQSIVDRVNRHPGLQLRGNSYRAVALAGQLGRASGTDEARVSGQPAAVQSSMAP